MTDVTVSLGENKYGKVENRVVRIVRDTPRHEIIDLNVTSQLRGAALVDSYLTGDNSLVDGAPHDHSFVRRGQGTRLATVTKQDGLTHVTGGVKDLTVLKSTGSEFAGFPRDKYTTLVETDDRIMATSVTGRWRFLPEAVEAGIDYNALYAEVSAILLSTFATVHSLALQQTLFAMGQAAIEARPEIAEVRFAMPNKHHFVYDLSPFGLENPNEVFIAADRPYGLIEGTIMRDGVAPAPAAWTAIPTFI